MMRRLGRETSESTRSDEDEVWSREFGVDGRVLGPFTKNHVQHQSEPVTAPYLAVCAVPCRWSEPGDEDEDLGTFRLDTHRRASCYCA